MSSIAITGLLHHKTVLSLKSRENIINAKLLRGLLNIRNKINLNTLIKSIYKVFYPTLNVIIFVIYRVWDKKPNTSKKGAL